MTNENIDLKPASLLAPVPVTMVSCRDAESGKANIITLAWVGVACSDPPMLSAAISKSRYSYDLIRSSGEFVVNLVDHDLTRACDWCGVKSGRDFDKFAECKLDELPLETMTHAPAIRQSPLSLACTVEKVIELGSHDLFIGRVRQVRAQAHLLDKNGRLRLDRAKLVAFNHGEYFSLKGMLGFFGYSVASAKVLARRMPWTKTGKP